jgi:hypothetical protein
MDRLAIKRLLFAAGLLSLMAISCKKAIPGQAIPSGNASIFPEYVNVTIPVNIAPLNFIIMDSAEKYKVHFHCNKGAGFFITSENGKIVIPERKWKALLRQSSGSDLLIDVYFRRDGQWFRNESIINRVVPDSIDSHLVYRLIEPGFETWNKMGIYQRNLESFHQSPVVLNEMSDGNCVNCHSFASHNSETMLIHSRAQHAGTIIVRNGKVNKVNTKTDSTISAGVYPSWHPGGRYIAFSVNHIVQSFHALPGRKVEVIDTLSDLILYDAENNCVIKDPVFSSPVSYETFPSWSPDGGYLYFCSASGNDYREFDQIRYDLLRVSFDVSTEKFGMIDTVISASKNGFSVSFPRISPDGRFLLYCRTSYGNFTIWHDDSDLVLLDLVKGTTVVPDINSTRAESYHTWSSGGRWVVFSSRREDGTYTRLYFSYFDRSGVFSKPFLLPQKDPGQNLNLPKSYNIPELVVSGIKQDPRLLNRVIRSQAEDATFKKTKN